LRFTSDKTFLGYILGDFLHKLIWSPCLAARVTPTFALLCFKLEKDFSLIFHLQIGSGKIRNASSIHFAKTNIFFAKASL
jgi:hypothetical protein